MNDLSRRLIIQIICLLFPIYFVLFYAGRFKIVDHWYIPTQLTGCALLIALIIFSIDRTLVKVEWRNILIIPMICCGVFMCIISYVHPVGDGYRIFAFMLFTIYPCFFIVWNNRKDYETLFKALSNGVAAVGIALLINAGWLAKSGAFIAHGDRFVGLFHDSNMFSMVGMSAFIGALYIIINENKVGIKLLFGSISLGSGISIVLMGQSRISLIVCVICLLISIFFSFRYVHKLGIFQVISRILFTTFFVVLMLVISNYIVAIQHDAIKESIQEEYMLADTVVQSATEVKISTDSKNVIDRFIIKDGDINKYSSGRLRIWYNYSKFLNIMGNDFNESDWSVLTNNSVKHAHNNFLEIAYRFGVPIGLLFIFIEGAAMFVVLGYLFNNRNKYYLLLLPILFMISFLFESLFDIATLPFERETACYFYLIMPAIADRNLNHV